MRIYNSLLASLGLSLAAFSAQAQAMATTTIAPERRYPQVSLGLTAGYGDPYGFGLDISVMVMKHLDVNVGAGFSITGGKIGFGTRYYFTPQRKVSPFIGANFVYSSGLDDVNISNDNSGNAYYGSSSNSYSSTNSGTAVNFKATNLLHIRGGVRWQPIHRFGLIGTIGYGIVLGGDAVEYVDPNQQSTNTTAISIFSPGGIELSVGVAFGLDSK